MLKSQNPDTQICLPSGKLSHSYGKSPFSMGKLGELPISMAISKSTGSVKGLKVDPKSTMEVGKGAESAGSKDVPRGVKIEGSTGLSASKLDLSRVLLRGGAGQSAVSAQSPPQERAPVEAIPPSLGVMPHYSWLKRNRKIAVGVLPRALAYAEGILRADSNRRVVQAVQNMRSLIERKSWNAMFDITRGYIPMSVLLIWSQGSLIVQFLQVKKLVRELSETLGNSRDFVGGFHKWGIHKMVGT